MDELSANRTFVRVVERGSISAAARDLGASITAVSRQVSGLEEMLGVRLLNRTTRKHALTEAGQIYYNEVLDILRRIETVKSEVSAHQDVVKGCLRVHLRTSVGSQVIVPALPRFLSRHPDVTLEVALTDERSDLVALGVDVAVWLGSLEDSGLIARRLSPSLRVICASKSYLRAQGQPKSPKDLAQHNCLVYSARSYDNIWRMTKNGETEAIVVSGNLRTDSSAVLLSSAVAGLGLVMLQEAMVRQSIASGELEPVLVDYQVSPTDADVALYAVHPNRRRVSPKTRAFVDFLVDLFAL
jgi:DNA-binding transcriptional LysR family regulator